ncbi:pyridoxal phosphate phosphatase PHOSPHO2-like [Chelonus insularis]|uniref:pyridoxal phosphate phosphatase PHOSPHO2-like n=1 Tax=Chelonus insularis TaxID=460826 RepID=UPI00158E4672|nr:pyridoxal phosphate phosphatase PHOSPHO2-like [Chelonus insularis]
MMQVSKPLLMCFDFDNTIINENSDIIIKNLYPHDVPDNVKKLCNSGWTAYMRSIFQLIHSIGVQKDTIINSIHGIPAVSGFEDLIKNLHANNCDIIIISDANSVFIETWLEKKQLKNCIDKIYTNPAWFDENNLLHIKEYHQQDWCKFSEKNLCKGYVLESYIKEKADAGVKYNMVAYVGDGRNDYCPMLKLSPNDIAFPRQDNYIMKMINDYKNSNESIKAKIIPWKDGNDIWQALRGNLNI